jgi:hypothetical protein
LVGEHASVRTPEAEVKKRRVTDEAYFTSSELALKCVGAVTERFALSDFDLVLEPSAGDGVFLDLLPKANRMGLDINPRRPDTLAHDFLLWRPDKAYEKVAVIGNPPFGQRAALAIRFIEHAAQFAEVIAFILPRSFNKHTFQDRVPNHFHLVHSQDCADLFLIDGGERHVKTVFQIWQRRATPRLRPERRDEHPHFEMKHAHLSRTSAEELERLRANFCFTIPQVGSQFRPRDVNSVTRGSHWFIRPLAEGVREAFEMMDFGFLENMNVAHTSLSKADIIEAYEAVLSVRGMSPHDNPVIGRDHAAARPARATEGVESTLL